MEKKNKIVIICGPTAVGKTALAIELAKKMGGEIVSADSQQVYKGLDIGTAKPSKEELNSVPHHLINIVEPDALFDAGKFVELADAAISDITSRGKIPFVVGGTGLYIKALCKGLVKAPEKDESYRKELSDILKDKGLPFLYEILRKKDPATAQKLKPADKQRITRALEVIHMTGRPISELQSEHSFSEERYHALKIGLELDRKELYRRIDSRVEKMVNNGLLDEVKQLAGRYGNDCRALKAVGYKEIIEAGLKISPEVVELIKRNTRHYAKRQMTWFRADKDIDWVDLNGPSGSVLQALQNRLRSFLSL